MVNKLFCDLCGEECTPKTEWEPTNPKVYLGGDYVSWEGDACDRCGSMISNNLEDIKAKSIELTQPIGIKMKERTKDFKKYLTKLVMLDKLSD